jgi:hypothetical protein
MTLDWNGQRALRQARFMHLVCALVAPIMYAGAIAMGVLGGRWQRFLEGWSRIPWRDPAVPPLLILALAAVGAALVVPPRIRAARSPLGLLRTRSGVGSIFLLMAAICGLVTGMKHGVAAAPLAFAILLAVVLAGLRLFPTEARWARALQN